MTSKNFSSLIEESIRKNQSLPSLSNYQEKSYSYAEVGNRIMNLHAFFKEAGIKKQDKIAVVSRNHANWAIVYLATVTYGAVIVPLLPDFKEEVIHELVNHSESSLLFAGSNIYDKLEMESMPGLRAMLSMEDFKLIALRKESLNGDKEGDIPRQLSEAETKDIPVEFEAVANDSLAAIIYTSGTTSMSKGVMLSHRSILENILYAQRNMPLESGNRIVSFLPLAHAYGCAFEFLFPFSRGCHVNFLSKTPSPQQIMAAFQDIRPELVLTVPLVIEKIYKKQIQPEIEKKMVKILLGIPWLNKLVKNKIRKKLCHAFGDNFQEFIIGGAPFNKEVEQFFRKIRFPFTVGYGMTECGPLITYIDWRRHRLETVGKVVDELELKIDSPDPAKIVGEICVKGSQVMMGYYKNEEQTKQTIVDGWLQTGDLGVVDKDGYVYIKGRSKSMILGPSGQNIYPEEIESTLNTCHFVMESLIINTDHRLIALIVPDFEQAGKLKISENKLQKIFEGHIKYLNTKLPAYSQISGFEIRKEEFVKTPTKKIKRYLYQK